MTLSLRTRRYLLPAVIAATAAIVASVLGIALMQQQQAQGQQSLVQIANSLEPIYPQVTVVNEKITSLQGTAITQLAKTSTSETIDRTAGISKSVLKDGQAELAMLHGVDSTGQDIIAATLTNTGTSKIFVASFLINGATSSGLGPLSAYAIDDDYSPAVWGNIRKPVITEAVALEPGESVSAYVKGWNSAMYANEPIDRFSVGAGYTFDNTVTEYKPGNNWSISISEIMLP